MLNTILTPDIIKSLGWVYFDTVPDIATDNEFIRKFKYRISEYVFYCLEVDFTDSWQFSICRAEEGEEIDCNDSFCLRTLKYKHELEELWKGLGRDIITT